MRKKFYPKGYNFRDLTLLYHRKIDLQDALFLKIEADRKIRLTDTIQYRQVYSTKLMICDKLYLTKQTTPIGGTRYEPCASKIRHLRPA